MISFPKTEKMLRAKISSYKSALKSEKKNFGHIHDGGGKRYVLFALYFVLNDLRKSEEYFDWYANEFPDDSGEPIQNLCWALGLNRMGKEKEARRMLADLMLSNLYLIPQLAGENVAQYDIWHASNFEFIDYVKYIPVEVRDSISQEEIEWMKTLYESFAFRRIRKRHIEIYHELLHAHGVEVRRPLVEEAYSLLDSLTD